MIPTRSTLTWLAATAFAAVLAIATPSVAVADDAIAAVVAPAVVSQPEPVTVTEGDDASFAVAFTGEPAPTVQWERSDDAGASWESIAGATAGTLTVSTTADDSGAQFRAQLVNEAGSATSDPAVLTVTAQAGSGEQGDEGTAGEDAGSDGSASTEAPADPGDTDQADADGAASDDAGSAEPGTDATGADTQPLASAAAPVSTADLSPGTYTITANLYVAGSDAPIGVNAYLTDAGFPPVTAQKLNATLVVGEDGSLLLTVSPVQEIFTLQRIGDADNATIVSAERGGSIAGAPADAPYSDRITRLTIALGDAGGQYTFTDVVEYPAPLAVEKTWPIHLSVDFAGAVRQVAGDFSQSYTDEATGVSLTVNAEEGSASIAQLQNAAFEVSVVDEGAERDAATTALGGVFASDPEFSLYDIALVSANGQAVTLDDTAIGSLSIPTAVDAPLLYRIDGVTATAESSAAKDGGSIVLDTRSLGAFAVVDGDSAAAWAGVKTLPSDIPGVGLSYSTTGFMEMALIGLDFATLDSFGIYNAYFDQITGGTTFDTAAAVIAGADGYDDLEIDGMYALGFDMSLEAFPANQKHSPFTTLGSAYENALSGTVPVVGAGSTVYIVSGTVGEGMTSVQRLDATIAGGSASFDLSSSELQDELAAMWNAASGWDGQFDSDRPDAHNWTDGTPLAYVVVAREAPTPVDKPTAATGLVYDGTAQTGVPAGEGYELSVVPTATAAGSYVAQATLTDGYAWSDGTTDPVVVTWSIAKAQLTARYAGETVQWGQSPQLAVEITGFVAGETAADAAGFAAPTVTAPSSLVAGKSYRLTPSGGAAANYDFAYVGGALTVTSAATAALAPGTYRVTANLYVPAEENDILHLTAYMTNPKNPLVAESDPNYGIPSSPVADNASLVVGTDGSRTLVIDLPNPAFTLIGFGAGDRATVLGVDRDGKSYGANTAGRITRVAIALDAGATSAVFADSHVYAAPLQLDKVWDLHLSVDLASAVRVSGGTTAPIPAGDGTSTGTGGGADGTGSGAVAPGTGTAGAQSSNVNATLKPGVYTVTANVWLGRADTGLPLDPHLTSPVFPPKDPVVNNATLVVDDTGRAVVTVPIVIQSRIMTVRSLSGDGVTTSGGDAVSSMTIDLGVLSGADTMVTRTLTAAVSIGELAMSIGGPIFGGTTEHTWPATFQLNLSGVPTSGGGAVPAWAAAAVSDVDTNDLTAPDEAALDAIEAAKKANEESKAAATADEPGTPAAGGSGDVALLYALVVLSAVLLLAAAATVVLVRRRRHGPRRVRA